MANINKRFGFCDRLSQQMHIRTPSTSQDFEKVFILIDHEA